ncbi:MAG: RNA polymerase factor sigma-54 [Rhizobiaceae bacterium]|nr:RNA polymerase factor sigma-54 [Rhizobiaceae bacterium]
MAQSIKLQLRQTQGLALTPQLMQSIKLLQMGSLELHQFIQKEIEKNPLLELNNATDEFPEERRGQVSEKPESEKSTGEQPRELDGQTNDWDIKAIEERLGTSLENVFESNVQQSGNNAGGTASNSPGIEFSGSANDLEAYVASQQSLREVLTQQATLTFRQNDELRIARDIIDLIDGDGYFRNDLEMVAKSANAEITTVADVLERIQKFDPPGVGARNLAECMRLQLIEKNRLDPAMRIFTENLELLARRDYARLAQLCDVDHEDLIDMAREIQELEPRPGDLFDAAPVQNIIADVFVTTNNDGSWQLELNTQALPKVLINREYYAQIKDLGLEKADKKFMIDNLQNANWLVASLDQRARTILKVATQIVKHQDMFFLKGGEFLKPLTLKMVAEEIEMHESTISRVTSNKYLACDRGIFEFKYFFMSGVGGTDGEASFGGQSIRLKIGNLIAAETKDSVLSDDKIASLLSNEGIDIARRTVTKYRESLGLLSSIQRRREKKALGGG